jgi:conjugative transfer region protein TrbK
MDGKLLARLGAIVFVAVVVTATAMEMARRDDAPVREPPRPAEAEHDPLREAQRRCQRIGDAAAGDPECLRVWAETRDRFLGRPARPSSTGTHEDR